MDAPGTVVISPRSAVTPLRLRREPRPDEVALLNLLVFGPSPVTAGPVGRCSKRGWCRAVSIESDGRGPGARALFELTPAGAEILSLEGAHDVGVAPAGNPLHRTPR